MLMLMTMSMLMSILVMMMVVMMVMIRQIGMSRINPLHPLRRLSRFQIRQINRNRFSITPISTLAIHP